MPLLSDGTLSDGASAELPVVKWGPEGSLWGYALGLIR